jgi:soluble lytic murein transglycosylase-like protein
MAEVLQMYMIQNMNTMDSNTDQSLDDNSSNSFTNLLQEIINEASSANTTVNNISQQTPPGTDLDAGSWDTNNSTALPGDSYQLGSGEINNVIEQAAQKYGIDGEFIKAIVKQESSYNPDAVSKAGAIGLMQLMPTTAQSLGVKNPFDVLENIDGGTKYIKKLVDSFGGNKELALSAYNGGIGRMNKRGVDTTAEIDLMPKETQDYVSKVMKNYEDYKKV